MLKEYFRAFIAIGLVATAAAVYLAVSACNVNESITAPGESQPPFWLWNLDADENRAFKVNPVSGSVVASFDIPFIKEGYQDNTGLTWGGGNFWYTYRNRENTPRLGKAQIEGTTFQVGKTWELSHADPSALAFEKAYGNEADFWSADATDKKIYRIRAELGRGITSIVSSFDSNCDEPRGLAWVSPYLWVSDKKAGLLYKIDTSENNQILGSYRSPGPEPTGLAWDGQHLWNADKYTALIYKTEPNGKVIVVDHFEAPRYSPLDLTVQR